VTTGRLTPLATGRARRLQVAQGSSPASALTALYYIVFLAKFVSNLTLKLQLELTGPGSEALVRQRPGLRLGRPVPSVTGTGIYYCSNPIPGLFLFLSLSRPSSHGGQPTTSVGVPATRASTAHRFRRSYASGTRKLGQ
jgi:hypothetical protein